MVRAALAGEGWFVGGEFPDFHGLGSGLRRAPGDASVHENEEKRARVSAVRVENKVQGREGTMVVCGIAAMLDLDGGDGCGRARPSSGAQIKLERGRVSGGGLEFQRGAGVVL